jgi:hypothetical protein
MDWMSIKYGRFIVVRRNRTHVMIRYWIAGWQKKEGAQGGMFMLRRQKGKL